MMQNNIASKSSPLKVILSLLILMSWFTGAFAAQSPVLNVFMVQNSGWMEPFYADDNSKLKPLVKAVIEKVSREDNDVVVATFNQSVGENVSPSLVYRGNDPGEIVKVIQNIKLARKPGDSAYADTDFKEAIVGAISQYSPGRPCILWIFTNNKNSPLNSPETAAKNKEFYHWLQDEDSITRIVAYTYPMPVKGKYYQANGIMIYAIAYGKPANDLLEQLIASKRPFDDRPARLKPLDADAVTFVPTGVAKQGNFNASLASDRSTLLIQFDSSSKVEEAVINGVFRNDFYPYDIRSADVSMDVKFFGESHGIQSAIEPRKLSSISSGMESKAVLVKIAIPSLPDMLSHPEIIFKSGYQAHAIMEFTLSNQQLQLSPDFIDRMNKIFPGDPLPEIFVPGESAKQSVTSRPLLVMVEYPVWPLVVLAILGLVLISGGLWFLAAVTRSRKYSIVVDGMQKTYTLKAFGECALYSDRGDRVGTLKRGLGKPTARLDQGYEGQVRVLQ